LGTGLSIWVDEGGREGYTRIRGIGRSGGGDGLYNAAAFMIFCYNFRAWERDIYIRTLST
jgi:hypothetical protein